MYCNLYVPKLQRELGAVGFIREHPGQPVVTQWYFYCHDRPDQVGLIFGRRIIRLDAVIDVLALEGPLMRRPYAGEIVTSRHHNMKELRVPAGDKELRVLFCFDPCRTAILLLGGDKSENSAWNAWYDVTVPEADDLYDVYLAELRKEGLLP